MPVARALVSGHGIQTILTRKNSIVTSYNRNFAKRNDGNPNTHAFVASPEITTALAIAGSLTFNPLTDYLTNDKGEKIKLEEPKGIEMPVKGFAVEDAGYQAPAEDGSNIEVIVSPTSDRLQILDPFPAWEGTDLCRFKIINKSKRKMYNRSYFYGRPMVKIPRPS